jgi:AcrR family transcriptional regulator
MTRPVKPAPPDRRHSRARTTEGQILRAAHELFVTRGWVGTTLTDVAAAADVAERTVYVRFGTKMALLQRVIDVAVVGDDEPVAVREREWYRVAMTAPTLDERIDAYAKGAAALVARAAPVIAVALQAAGSEPGLAAAARAGHLGTRDDLRRLGQQAHKDGLIPDSVDLRWFLDTITVVGQADVYLLGVEVHGWTQRRYEKWLAATVRRLAGL